MTGLRRKQLHLVQFADHCPVAHIFPTTKHSNRKKNIKVLIKRKLEVKLPTIWTAEKAEVGRDREEKRREEKKENQRREEKRRKKIREEKESEERRCRRAKKVEKMRNTVFSNVLWLRRVEKYIGSLKRRVRSHLRRLEMKNCTPLWHERHLQAKMRKAPRWKLRCSTVHAVLARSKFPKQNGPPFRSTCGRSNAPHYSTTTTTRSQEGW